jgi:rubrerythrin
MSQEQDATLAALQFALKMEEDGKAFYLKASKASGNPLGAQLFKNLAAEEDIHRKVFEKIYDKIKNKKQWPETKFVADGGKNLKTVFSTAMEKMDKDFTPAQSELDAVKTGIAMENKTLDYYRERKEKALSSVEQQFFEQLTMQESQHAHILEDYYEFYSNPASYYNMKEHLSVDGG